MNSEIESGSTNIKAVDRISARVAVGAVTLFPPSSLRHLLRRGYEGQEGFYRQAGLAHRQFQEPPAKSKFLAVIRAGQIMLCIYFECRA